MHFEPVGEPDTSHRRLKIRGTRVYRGQFHNDGFAGLLFGVPLTVGATLAMLGSRGLGPVTFLAELGSFGTALAAAFALAGIYVCVVSVLMGMRRSRQRLHAGGAGASEPWLHDYPWEHDQARDDRLARGAMALASGLLLTAVLSTSAVVLSNLLAFWRDASGDAAAGDQAARYGVGIIVAGIAIGGPVLLLFIALTFYLLYTGSRLLVNRWRHGPVRLVYDTFPFFLGESVRGRLEGLPELRDVTVELRCVFEAVERRGGDALPFAEQHWAQAYALCGVDPRDLPGRAVNIDLPLPADNALTTRFGSETPRYWELAIVGKRRWASFHATLVIPVYAAPPSRR